MDGCLWVGHRQTEAELLQWCSQTVFPSVGQQLCQLVGSCKKLKKKTKKTLMLVKSSPDGFFHSRCGQKVAHWEGEVMVSSSIFYHSFMSPDLTVTSSAPVHPKCLSKSRRIDCAVCLYMSTCCFEICFAVVNVCSCASCSPMCSPYISLSALTLTVLCSSALEFQCHLLLWLKLLLFCVVFSWMSHLSETSIHATWVHAPKKM